jgi:hypothetical protein
MVYGIILLENGCLKTNKIMKIVNNKFNNKYNKYKNII